MREDRVCDSDILNLSDNPNQKISPSRVRMDPRLKCLYLTAATVSKCLVLGLLVACCSCTTGSVQADVLHDVVNENYFCRSMCEKNFPVDLIAPTYYRSGHMAHKQNVCCRGCSFYNVASSHLGAVPVSKKKRANPNATRTACETSCTQEYSDKDDRIYCFIGCSIIAYKKHNVAIESQLLWAVYVEDGNNILVIRPAEFEPAEDVLTDPGLRSQLTNEAGDRLPQTHIRSLPDFEDKLLEIEIKNVSLDSGNFLDCLSRRTGFPKLAIVGIVLLAMLCAVLVILSNMTSPQYKRAFNVGLEEPLLSDLPPKYSLAVEQV